MESNEHIELIILKHLNREASPSEQAELQQWLDSDPEHRQYYGEWEKIWKDSGPLLHRQQFDAAAAWEKIKPGLLSNTKKPSLQPVIMRLMGKRILRIAAVTLPVFICLAWLFYRHHAQGTLQVILAEKTDSRIILPDGSLVYLRRGSALKYDGAFGHGERPVELNGEAFFEIARDQHKPFIVRTEHAFIEDLGTSFQVKDQNLSGEVTVVTGKVKFIDRTLSANSIILFAGQKALLKENKFIRGNIADSNFMAWKTGVLDFRDSPLDQVAEDLHDFYQVAVSLAPDLQADAGKIRVTSRFEGQTLEGALEEIRLTTGLGIKKDRDTLYFYRP